MKRTQMWSQVQNYDPVYRQVSNQVEDQVWETWSKSRTEIQVKTWDQVMGQIREQILPVLPGYYLK